MKTNNLLQTYITQHNMSYRNDRNLDIEKELSNRTFIKPLPGKGKLVNSNLLNAPINVTNDIAYDIKSFNKSIKGTANDHELGKVNDIGMKIGGLAIAGYLITKKQAPFNKIMELIGLTSFFAAMKLWPKIALQIPAKLIHGFNIRKEYKDSDGRKKMLFQDPQYIPWDLLSDKEINKIGNRMRVPKDMQNRREYIQEKMRKIAVQNNTLWMLTAGFATPVMSALMCNILEKPVKNIIAQQRSKKADILLDEIKTRYVQFKDTQTVKNLEEFLKNNSGKKIDEPLFNKIAEIFTTGFAPSVQTAITTDLKNQLLSSKRIYFINDKSLKNSLDTVTSMLRKEFPDFKLPNIEEFKNLLISKNLMNTELNEAQVQQVVYNILRKTKDTLILEPNIDKQKVVQIFPKINASKEFRETMLQTSYKTLDESIITPLKKLGEILTDFKAKNTLLDKYAYLKFADAPDTLLAHNFTEVSGSLLKTFGFTSKEIKNIRFDRTFTKNLLREKIEDIVSNDAKYEEVMTILSEKLDAIEKQISSINPKVTNNYTSAVTSVFDTTASALKDTMPQTAQKIAGVDQYNIKGSLKNIQLSFAKERLLGVRSTFYRLINTLDFYKRVAENENLFALTDKMPLEIKEEIVEFCKKISLEGTTSDFMTKFYELRNPNPNPELGDLTVIKGKVQNKFLNSASQKIDLASDQGFFQDVMRLLFKDKYHPKTQEILANTSLAESLKEYRHIYIHEMGNFHYFEKPHHMVEAYTNNANSLTKFLQTGLAPDQLFHNIVKDTFNTTKWRKIFGFAGLGILGITVLAQFFFGKIKEAKEVQK